MDKKLYLIDLDCYARADEKQKKKVKESHCFDFGLLPTKGFKKNSVPLLRIEADNVPWQR